MDGCNRNPVWWSGEQVGKWQGAKNVTHLVSGGWARGGHTPSPILPPGPPPSATHRGARAVLPSLWDLCLVGVVGTADHGAGGGQPSAPAPSSTAACLPAWQALLLQFRLPCAGWAALGVQGCGRRTTW